MNVTVHFTCPLCGKENSVEYDVSENFCDVYGCGECGKDFTQKQTDKIFEEVMEQAWNNVVDSAEYWMEDR